MSQTTAVDLVIGLLVLAFILFRQMQARPVRANMRLPLILGIIGVIELSQYLERIAAARQDTGTHTMSV
jgi:hypothetical protein